MYRIVKRLIDIAGALTGLLVLSPIIVVAAVLVRVDLGHPIVFRQARLGHRERPFTLFKFRTMRDARDPEGRLLPDAERLSPVGAFLRRTSIDELPQLWNVLTGAMSLVGPRPLFVHYLEYYTERERRRHCVRPGITGLAQVSGRNTLLWDDRLALDVEYVDRVSWSLDCEILGQTLRKVASRGDIHVIPGLAQGPLSRYRTARKLPDTPFCP